MSEQQKSGNYINANLSNINNSGQIAVSGDGEIHQLMNTNATQVGITEQDLESLQQLIANLKAQVEAEAPPEKQTSATERVEELEKAIVSKKPNVNTIKYVKDWFAENLPKLAGAVSSVVIHPIVGKVVEVAGVMAADKFKEMMED